MNDPDKARASAPDAQQRHSYTTEAADVLAAEAAWLSAARTRREEARREEGGASAKGPTPNPDLIAPTALEPGHAALALSGGGIRSATFALGLLQVLARERVLDRFDYLSTVSGGGYIGSAVTWARKWGRGLGEDFCFGTDDPSRSDTQHKASPSLKRLRDRGKYLTPGGGITLLSGAAVLLRGTLLNWLVWFPLFTLFLMALTYVPLSESKEVLWDARFDTLHIAAGDRASAIPRYRLLEFIAFVPVALFVLSCVIYSLTTYSHRNPDGLFSKMRNAIERYRWRIRFEIWMPRLLIIALAFVVVASLPWTYLLLIDVGPEGTGFLASLSGLISGGFAYLRSGKSSGLLSTAVIATLGGVLLIYGFLMLAFGYVVCLDPTTGLKGCGGPIVFFGLILAAVLSGHFVNLNYITLHRFYRDRLMEAFMPNHTPDKAYPWMASEADSGRISAMCGRHSSRRGAQDDEKADVARGPYHLVNTNLVLLDSQSPQRNLRGGDSFLLSPLYSGSPATGWLDTKDFMGDGMMLSTAMAISGAAAHPNTGVGGSGLTRNPIVSLLMALMNIRLGYWIPNPKTHNKDSMGLAHPKRHVNHFASFLYEVGLMPLDEEAGSMQLSDGGHFENLGIYELVRREVRLIVASDCGADPDFAFEDLQNCIRRCAQDFGADFDFDVPGGGCLSDLIAINANGQPAVTFPRNLAQPAKREGYIVGRVTYASGAMATLVYIKSTMIEGLSIATKGYRGAHSQFPDQTTADQFFDDKQFEAYRELGYRTGEAMLDDKELCLASLIDTVTS